MYWNSSDKVFSSLVTNNGVTKYCEINKFSDSYEIKISKTGDSIINFITNIKAFRDNIDGKEIDIYIHKLDFENEI